jgi:hypothetical protein
MEIAVLILVAKAGASAVVTIFSLEGVSITSHH